jgi:hypothetical protein
MTFKDNPIVAAIDALDFLDLLLNPLVLCLGVLALMFWLLGRVRRKEVEQ